MSRKPNWRPMARGSRRASSFSFKPVLLCSPTGRQPVTLIGHLRALPFLPSAEELCHRPFLQAHAGCQRRQGQALRVLRSLDPAAPQRLQNEGGHVKRNVFLFCSSHTYDARVVSLSLLLPLTRARSQPPADALARPAVGHGVTLNRTVRGYELVSRTDGPFRTLHRRHRRRLSPKRCLVQAASSSPKPDQD